MQVGILLGVVTNPTALLTGDMPMEQLGASLGVARDPFPSPFTR